LPWLTFIISALVIVLAGTQLTRNAERIITILGLGVIWGGALLLPLATSLPELITSWRAGIIGAPDLPVGNVLGSSLFNLALIAIIDIFQGKGSLLSRVDHRHIMTASLLVFLLSLLNISLFSPVHPSIKWVGVDTLLILLFYLAGSYLISREEKKNSSRDDDIETNEDVPQNSQELPPEGKQRYVPFIIFLVAAILIIIAGINLTDSADEISQKTGLGRTFVGSLFLAFSTSLPEIVTTYTAVRMGMLNMAVANVFGASLMNVTILFFADLFYREAPILSHVSQGHLITVNFVIALSAVAIFGLIYRTKREIAYLGYDAIIILLGSLLAYIFLFYIEVIY